MRRNTPATTDRNTNASHPGPTPVPARAPRRTTAGLVAATLVPATVVAAVFVPVATAAVATVALTVAVAATVARHNRDTTGKRTHDPGDAPVPPGEAPAD